MGIQGDAGQLAGPAQAAGMSFSLAMRGAGKRGLAARKWGAKRARLAGAAWFAWSAPGKADACRSALPLAAPVEK